MMFSPEKIAILNRFNFKIPPVAVRFSSEPPQKIRQLDGSLAFCEMLKRAQEGEVFYAGKKNHSCEAGLYVLGQADAPEQFINGAFGAGLQIYEAKRAASRLYHHIPTIGRGIVHYVAFSTLDKLSFEPDLLIILAETGQTEILLRAMSYKTGRMWHSRCTPAIGCAWIYIYPYLKGEMNYIVSGLGHGMKRRSLFPEGRQLISIPFDHIASTLQTLQEMPWVLPAYKPDGLEFVRRLLEKLGIA
jgi:uncharacterized protein (DUF169 family)